MSIHLQALSMPMTHDYSPSAPSRDEVNALPGATLLEFGTGWCGYCRAAQPLLESALSDHPELRHLKVEDGKGRPLGRSFRVTLWPTLIFLRDGIEIERLVRPASEQAIAQSLARLTSA